MKPDLGLVLSKKNKKQPESCFYFRGCIRECVRKSLLVANLLPSLSFLSYSRSSIVGPCSLRTKNITRCWTCSDPCSQFASPSRGPQTWLKPLRFSDTNPSSIHVEHFFFIVDSYNHTSFLCFGKDLTRASTLSFSWRTCFFALLRSIAAGEGGLPTRPRKTPRIRPIPP